MGQDQVSGWVSALWWLDAAVAMFNWNLSKFGDKVKIGNIRSSSVISSQIGVMSDQLSVSLYMAMSRNIM